MTIDDANGLVQVSWDGMDGGPPPTGSNFPTVNFNGLGGVDLTAGLLDAYFQVLLTFSDVGGPLNLWVYENGGGGTQFASGTIALPGGVPAGSTVELTKAFDTFVLNGATTLGDIFTNVGAIVMEINATAVAQEGWDMRTDYLKTRGTERSPVPVPATLLLVVSGLLGLRFARRS